MSSEVKRYDPINSDGTCGTCVEDPGYGAYVEFADYAALEAELAKLRAGQEPVAFKKPSLLMDCNVRYSTSTTPQPSAVPDDHTEQVLVMVPAGWKLVPVEPTLEMLDAAKEQADCMGDWYRAMLAAAPSAPATVQADGWIPVSERLPDVEQRLDEPCEIDGKSLPPLNITRTVQCFDGKRVFADAIEWFDGGQPMKGVTYWKPLDAAPAAIAAAREGGKV